MKKYDILIAKLYACCGNQEEFPREPITVDNDRMSELLEGVFMEEGLLESGRMIKVKAEANYGFAGTNMTFEEEFGDDVTDEEIEEAMRDMVMEQVNWSWERV